LNTRSDPLEERGTEVAVISPTAKSLAKENGLAPNFETNG